MNPLPRELVSYETANGKCPFQEWLTGLRDRKGRSVIALRLDRFGITGNPGFCKRLGEGICELKIDFGPGYRVYFGEDGPTKVVLLCGGDKDSQNRNIRTAKLYWNDYWRRK